MSGFWFATLADPLPAACLAALAGLLLGAWLDGVVDRLPAAIERDWRAQCGELPGAPPAVAEPARAAGACPHCGAPPAWPDRLPLAGWLLRRGRCAACGGRLSRRRPAVQAGAALMFLACAWRFGPTPLALAAMGLCAALLVLACIDLRHSLLPDSLTLPLLWAGLLVNLGGALAPLEQAVLGAAAGYLVLWAVFHAYRLLTGREGMGYGDFKLLAALGAWLGAAALPLLLLGASVAGAAVGLALVAAGRAGRSQPLPFGPYLAAAGLALLLGGPPSGFF